MIKRYLLDKLDLQVDDVNDEFFDKISPCTIISNYPTLTCYINNAALSFECAKCGNVAKVESYMLIPSQLEEAYQRMRNGIPFPNHVICERLLPTNSHTVMFDIRATKYYFETRMNSVKPPETFTNEYGIRDYPTTLERHLIGGKVMTILNPDKKYDLVTFFTIEDTSKRSYRPDPTPPQPDPICPRYIYMGASQSPTSPTKEVYNKGLIHLHIADGEQCEMLGSVWGNGPKPPNRFKHFGAPHKLTLCKDGITRITVTGDINSAFLWK